MEKEMWDAYAKQAGGVTFDGKPLPTWDELGEERQACWKAAASVCADEIERLREALRKHAKTLRVLYDLEIRYNPALQQNGSE